MPDTEEHPTNSDTGGKLHIRQLTHDECFEMVHNGGRLLSEEYRSKYFQCALGGYIDVGDGCWRRNVLVTI